MNARDDTERLVDLVADLEKTALEHLNLLIEAKAALMYADTIAKMKTKDSAKGDEHAERQ